MESGQRKDKEGNAIPRSIINRFTCDFNGTNAIDVTLEPAISTNPYFQFEVMIPEAGELTFTWYDDDGSVYETSKKVANLIIELVENLDKRKKMGNNGKKLIEEKFNLQGMGMKFEKIYEELVIIN